MKSGLGGPKSVTCTIRSTDKSSTLVADRTKIPLTSMHEHAGQVTNPD